MCWDAAYPLCALPCCLHPCLTPSHQDTLIHSHQHTTPHNAHVQTPPHNSSSSPATQTLNAMAQTTSSRLGGLGQQQQLLHLQQSIPVLRQLSVCRSRGSRLSCNQSSVFSGKIRSSSRRSSVIAQAVAAPAPESLIEKGGPGTTYANGAVAKVRGETQQQQQQQRTQCEAATQGARLCGVQLPGSWCQEHCVIV